MLKTLAEIAFQYFELSSRNATFVVEFTQMELVYLTICLHQSYNSPNTYMNINRRDVFSNHHVLLLVYVLQRLTKAHLEV